VLKDRRNGEQGECVSEWLDVRQRVRKALLRGEDGAGDDK
jgi:hypothetical protein